ncbi:MAG: T9SS type A sorting domain-containing protein [Bacteroidetes bacterium]|nr:T9SS type A sorting domain-containing protein [Bacteroidota bacterium]
MQKLKYTVILIILLFNLGSNYSYSQGMNSHWLLGYDVGLFDTNVVSTKAVFQFDSLGYSLDPSNFKMPFRAAQSTLSDELGNLNMVTNGCWIADATGDTMLNGGGLLQNSFSVNWCDAISGIPMAHTSIFVPHPIDSNLVYLLHQSGTSSSNYKSSGLYFTLVDKTLNNGLGGVVTGQKNQLVFSMGLNPGMSVCKHANGRDWWVLTMKDSSDIVYVNLLSPSGFSAPVGYSLGFSPAAINFIGQMNFSPDGRKFAYSYYLGNFGAFNYYTRIADFDRCSGLFSNSIQLTFTDPNPGLGLCFSPDSKKLYISSTRKIVQFNIDTSNIAASLDTVAINDGYYSPYPPLQSDFWLMTLAANGKIYISSGSSVIDLHYINYPDSDGVACDIMQHSIRLPCYSIRGHVYHPNYYLGCDTTLGCPCLVSTGLNENGKHDFSIKLSPNPGSAGFEILYLLPQNKNGILSVYDLQGRLMHKQSLPPWSAMQHIPTSNWAGGVYQVRIESDGYFSTSKWVKF